MPYVPKTKRLDITYEDTRPRDWSSGELNYILTRLILDHLGPEPRYAHFNNVVGVLECVKQELYRRMAAPYEDSKCKENGDVFPVVGSSSPGRPE